MYLHSDIRKAVKRRVIDDILELLLESEIEVTRFRNWTKELIALLGVKGIDATTRSRVFRLLRRTTVKIAFEYNYA